MGGKLIQVERYALAQGKLWSTSIDHEKIVNKIEICGYSLEGVYFCVIAYRG